MAEEIDANAGPGLSFEMHTVASRKLRLAALGQQLRQPRVLVVRSSREDGGLLHIECGPPRRTLRLGGAPQRFVLRTGADTTPLTLLLARKVTRRAS